MAGLRTWGLPIGRPFLNILFGLFLLSSPLCSAKTFEIDPKTVDLETREMWCAMELQTCSLICNQVTQMSKQDNYCNATTLEYKCRCKSWEPPMERYEHTLPTFLCTKTYDDCVKNSFGDLGAQNSCTVSIKRFCGDLTPVPGGGGAGVSGMFENQSQQPTKAPSDTKSTTIPAATASNANAKASPPTPDPLEANKQAASSSSSRNSTSTDEDDEDTDGNPGRDTGAKAGIAAGAVAALALVICVIYIYRLRKKAALSNSASWTSNEPRELDRAENGLKASPSNHAAELGGQFGLHQKQELDGKALEDGGKEWAVEMEQPGAVRGVPAAVHELEVYSPVELDATGNTFELVGSIRKKG
ncbi:hypothetical protein V8F33_000695 [Rhypophila sp. PSN 637]